MAGRTKQPVYIYNYKGAFLEKLESKTEYIQKYFTKSRNSTGNVYFNKYGITLIDEQFVATQERIGRDKIKVIPDVLIGIGEVDGIMYSTVRDGVLEKYVHRFAKKARPLFAVSHDGKQLFMLGGAYNFTERGIVDET